MTADRIRQALQDLNAKMDQLEQDFDVKSKAVKKRAKASVSAQQDLFAAPAAIVSVQAATAAKPANDPIMAAMASKLDNAIAKVQKLLKEAEA